MRLSGRFGFTRAFLWLGYIAVLFVGVNIAYLALTPVVPPARNVFSAETVPFIWPFLAVAIPFILWLSVGSFYVRPPLSQQMRLHKAYVRGEPTALIQPQPVLIDQDVQEVWIRLKRPHWSSLFAILLVFCTVAPLWFLAISFPDEPVRSIVQLIALSYLAVELLAFAVLPGGLFAASPSLRAESESLAVINLMFNKRQTIKWREARIFARVGTYRRYPYLAYYELVDDKESLTFALALKPPSRFALVKPATSFEEYQQQVEQLLGMITAKTGLPLVDLRSR
jgi:hypothetical protein